MHVGVLGPLEVHHDGAALPLGRRKQRALLAALVAARGSTVSLDRLVDLLWDDEPPARATASLQAYVSNLRRLIEPGRLPRADATRLVSRPPGYALIVSPEEVDATRFVTLLDAARTELQEGRSERAGNLLDEGLALWRGPAYGEFADEPFAIAEAGRLEELRLGAIEARLEVALATGHHHSVVADAEALVTEHPLREEAWGLLMLALYRSGRQADALRAFQRARRILRDQLGLDPNARLRQLERDVLAQAPGLDRLDRSGRTRVSVQPARPRPDDQLDPAGSLVGRDHELERLTAALGRARRGSGGVIVVAGEAGAGKSALADAVARRAAADDATAIGVGRSHETRDAAALAPWYQVLRGLGLRDGPAAEDLDDDVAPGARRAWIVDRIIELARSRSVLIVIDDIQWADGPSQHVLRLLADEVATARVLVIVTRRIPADVEDAALVETMGHLARAHASERLELLPLGADDGIELIRRIAGTVSDDVAATMHERAAGNPFFVVELARLVAAEGPDASADVPSTVRDVIRQRLARLPDQAVAVITIAAVLGADLDVRAIAEIARLDLDEVHDLIELGVVVGLLTDESGLRFAHDLVRNTIESTLTKLRLARLHHAAVDALVTVHGDDRSRVHAIARHALGAVPVTGPAPAVEHLIASGRASHWALDLRAAIQHFQLATELAAADPHGDPTIHARFLLVRAQLEFLIDGRTPQIVDTFRRAREELTGEGGEYEVSAALAWGSYSALWGDLATTAEQASALRKITGPAAAAAASSADYLDAYAGWAGNVDAARRALEASIVPNAFAVGEAIRRGVLSVLDVLADRPDAARDNAAAAIRIAVDARGTWSGRSSRGAAPDTGPWVAAWAGSFAAVASCLVSDSGEDPRAVVDAAQSVGGGIRFTDLVLDACSHAAAALDGDTTAIGRLSAGRHALAEAGDGLFGIPLAVIELRCRAALGDRGDELRAATEAAIAAAGQLAWCRPLAAVDRPLAIH